MPGLDRNAACRVRVEALAAIVDSIFFMKLLSSRAEAESGGALNDSGRTKACENSKVYSDHSIGGKVEMQARKWLEAANVGEEMSACWWW